MLSMKMFSRKQVLSAMAGVAMLALPVSAFAGRHDDNWNHARPFASHDRGLHKGWAKHHWNHGGWYGTPAQRPAVNYAPPTSQPYGWNNGYRRGCDDDGDRCGWQANATVPTNYGYNSGPRNGVDDEDGGGAYSSYLQQPPAGYNQSQSLSGLMARRQQTMLTIAQLRARHDSRGAARLVPAVKALNRRIGATNRRVGYNGGYGYAPTPNYVAPSSLINAMPYNSMAPYNNRAYNNGAYYGTPYTGNPTVDALTSIAVPMLSGVR